MSRPDEIIDAEYTVVHSTTERCSSLPLALKCPASRAKPEIRHGAGEAADIGTAFHDAIASHIIRRRGQLGPVNLSVIAAKHRVDVNELEVLFRKGVRVWSEHLAQHFDLETADVEPTLAASWQVVSANSLSILDLTGHTDLESFRVTPMGREMFIIDWKTGYGDYDYLQQFMGYAAIAYINAKIDTVRIAEVKVRDGVVDWYVIGQEEIVAWLDKAAIDLNRPATTFVPGDHCRFCPRAGECPSRNQLVRQISAELIDIGMGEREVVPLSLENRGLFIAHLLAGIKIQEDLIEKARGWIDSELALRGTIPTGDGRELYLNAYTKREVVPEFAMPLIQERFGDRLAEIVSIGIGKLEEVAGDNAPPRGKAKKIKDFMAELGAAGGIRAKHLTKIASRPVQQEITHVEPATAEAPGDQRTDAAAAATDGERQGDQPDDRAPERRGADQENAPREVPG